MKKSDIIQKLRPAVGDLLSELESKTELGIDFQPLPANSHVIAEYYFDPHTNTPTIFLGSGCQDCDVAHELMHMKLELVEGYYVLAWRHGITQSNKAKTAFGRVRTYVDDQVVHARLAGKGFELDGEVLKPQLFDDIYTRVPRYLNKLRPPSDDGMAHLDDIGYGDLCRSSFLVQAELILQSYADQLPYDRVKRAKRFIEAFRTYRRPQAEKADKILSLFKEHDVQLISGHKQILWEWAQIERLDNYVGPSCYHKQNGTYTLPWPQNSVID